MIFEIGHSHSGPGPNIKAACPLLDQAVFHAAEAIADGKSVSKLTVAKPKISFLTKGQPKM